MDRRTKILGAFFGAALAYAAYSSYVYPKWVAPILSLDDQIAQRAQELDKLERGEEVVHRARETYLAFLNRIGSFDPVEVENDLRERLNTLIKKHQLEDQSVTRRGPTTDRKTDISKITISMSAVGSLQATVGFLRDISELPHLLRVGNITIFPVSSFRAEAQEDKVNLRVPIDVYILPQHKLLGRQLADKELTRPDRIVRHEDHSYEVIAEHEPFTEYIPPKPLVALAGRNLSVDSGEMVILKGTITGGVGAYAIHWTPEEEFQDPTSLTPRVRDTTAIGDRMYTLSVTDEAGNSSNATVTLTIREAPKVVESESPPDTVAPTEENPTGPALWAGREHMRLKMALVRMEAETRSAEVLVSDIKAHVSHFYATGDEFDGGQLMYVYPRGALVRRDDAYFVYPIGAPLDEDIPVEEAVDFPRLMQVADWFESAQANTALRGSDLKTPDDTTDSGAAPSHFEGDPKQVPSDENAGDGGLKEVPEDKAGPGGEPPASKPVADSESKPSVSPGKGEKPRDAKEQKGESKEPTSVNHKKPARKTRPAKSRRGKKVIPGKN